ncbi:D-alanyl-D-alanine dipeptidase [Oceaniferula spumae]|uniref:D-alanyl-D-alanine dipeptidase n=1 Tax=Oceaniferula spumae TaxID=2979115 RepID=A0AAT9FKC7_9BACT
MRALFPLGLCCFLTACSSQMNETPSAGPQGSQELPVSKDPVLAKAGLIEIAEVDRSIFVDLQYKGASPISTEPLYSSDFKALLKPETAVRLKKANNLVKGHGYRILVWDAYRPPSAQMKLWHASGHNDTFVANPNSAPSQHSCGTAVDVTLVTSRGKPVKMPTGFDAFTANAASNYTHKDPEVLRNVQILQSAMHAAGFYPLPAEWWHYIDKNYHKYPDTIPLSAIQPQN